MTDMRDLLEEVRILMGLLECWEFRQWRSGLVNEFTVWSMDDSLCRWTN